MKKLILLTALASVSATTFAVDMIDSSKLSSMDCSALAAEASTSQRALQDDAKELHDKVVEQAKQGSTEVDRSEAKAELEAHNLNKKNAMTNLKNIMAQQKAKNCSI